MSRSLAQAGFKQPITQSPKLITAIVSTKVADFDKWLPLFTSHADERAAHGCSGCQVFRGMENPNDLTLVFSWSNPEAMGTFMSNPDVQKKIAEAGTIGMPAVTLCSHVSNFAS